MKIPDKSTICSIQNSLPDAETKKLSLTVRPNDAISSLYRNIQTQLDAVDFELFLSTTNDKEKVSLYIHNILTKITNCYQFLGIAK